MGLEDALQAAENGLADQNNTEIESTETVETAPKEQPQTQSPVDQASVDLSKYEKIMFDGKEWTRDELKRSIMLNKDYTSKTQELARMKQEAEQFKTQAQQEREQVKFESAYSADLAKIRTNPALVAEFMKVYPKQFHDRLFEDLRANEEVDPKYLHLMKETHDTKQLVESFNKERDQERLASIDQGFEAQETKLLTKYPDAHFGDVYAKVQAFAKSQGIDGKNLQGQNLTLLHQKMEEFAKQSHEVFESKIEERLKAKAKAQIEANKKGTDIGRGGAAPSQAPSKTKLKDAAEEWMKHLNQ